ncbi:MAG: hypothetical protein ACP6IY_11000 [Promethearchaeia archaeon]
MSEDIEKLLEKLDELEVADLFSLFKENKEKINELIKLNEKLIKKLKGFEVLKNYEFFLRLGEKFRFKEGY